MGIITVMKLGSMSQAEVELLNVKPHKYKGSQTPILWDNNRFWRFSSLVLSFFSYIVCLLWTVWKDLMRNYVIFILLFKQIKYNWQEQDNISNLCYVVVLWYIPSFACHSHASGAKENSCASGIFWTHCFNHHCTLVLIFCPPVASKMQRKIILKFIIRDASS